MAADRTRPNEPLPGQLLIEREHRAEETVIRLYGELDLASAAVLEREVSEAAASSPARIVLDLDGLGFIDSTGLRALLEAHMRGSTDGFELVLRRAPNQARRLFEVTGMTDRLNIES